MTTQLDRIETKLDHILMNMQNARPSTTTPPPKQSEVTAMSMDATQLFHNWTVKQHCVLQMVLRSASNEEIAERMKVTLDGAKMHVRTLARKLGVSTRSEIATKTIIPMREVDAAAYMIMARGLPKDWDVTYSDPDPCNSIIHGVG